MVELKRGESISTLQGFLRLGNEKPEALKGILFWDVWRYSPRKFAKMLDGLCLTDFGHICDRFLHSFLEGVYIIFCKVMMGHNILQALWPKP